MKKYFNIYLSVLFLILCLNYGSCRRLWIKKGGSCMDGPKNGTCLPIQECRIRYPERSIQSYIKCSVSKRVTIVCCAHIQAETPTVYSTQKPIIDPVSGQPLMKTGQKAWDKCLDYLKNVNYPCKGTTHVNHVASNLDDSDWEDDSVKENSNKTISGGKDAQTTQFPHMALLGYGDETKSISWTCGGSLISEKFVLTAGHCIADSTLGPVKYVALGILRRSDVPTIAQRRLVQKIIPHPDYHAPIKYNDIALLEMDQRAVFSRTVAPACLALPELPQRTSTLMIQGVCATGWGFLGRNKKLADTLQVAYLKEFDYMDCCRLYPVHRNMPQGFNNATQVCYGDKDRSKDTCQGDSGGPLQIPGQASDCQHSIIAVTSYGISCPSEAGMYTRVRPYISWIESVVWP